MSKLAVIILALSGICPSFVLAQASHVEPVPQCLAHFNDSHNWMAYRNTCNVTIYVAWIGQNGHLSGSAPLNAGETTSTGWSSTEVSSAGGLTSFACPTSYIPVDANDRFVTSPVARYFCKYRGY